MAGEIFNPNPTIFKSSTKSSISSRQLLAAKKSLWLNEVERSREEETEEDSAEEVIDQDEIFGPIFLDLLHLCLLRISRHGFRNIG